MVNDNSWYSVANQPTYLEPEYNKPLYPGDVLPSQEATQNYQFQPQPQAEPQSWSQWALGGAQSLLRQLSRPAAAVHGAATFGREAQEQSPVYDLGLFKVQGFNPETLGAMASGAYKGFVSPETVAPNTELPFVRNLPENIAGLPIRNVAGTLVGTLSDPLTALGGPKVTLASVFGGESAQKIAEKAGFSEEGQFAASLAGGLLGGGIAGARKATAGLGKEISPEAFKPQTAAESVFGIRSVEPELSRGQNLLNHIKETIGFGTPDNEYATPIMQERRRIRDVTESQASRFGNLADYVYSMFDTDKNGGIKQFEGAPTLQDVAAKFPLYAKDLNERQLTGLTRLRDELAPFNKALNKMGIAPGVRSDIIEGGFYLPRGNALAEGVDMPLVRPASAMRGSRKGFERPEEFGSMASGIREGYTYSPFPESIQSYVRDLGNRVGDQWATNQFKESGLGLTAKESVLESNPALAAKKKAIDNSLSKLLTAHKSLTDDTVKVIERFISDPDFTDIEELRAALPATVKRGTYAGMSYGDLQQALVNAKADLNDIRGQWKSAIEKAKNEPGKGSIGFYGLTGSAFPDAVANVANKYLNQEMPLAGRGSQTVGVVKAFNNIMRGLRASTDLSFMGIQGLLGAATHPFEYGKAMKVALQSVVDPNAFGKFVNNFDDAARAAGRLTSSDWAALGSKISGGVTEFSPSAAGKIGQVVGKVPGVSQSERAFSSFGDSLRLISNDGLYRAMTIGDKALSQNELQQITKFSNLMTGYSNRRFLGDTGELFQFAPRFFQSQLDLLGSALLGGEPIVRQQAFNSLRNLIGVGTLLTYAANTARGEETSFNPADPNFLRIRDVGGNDVSLFGPWDSLMRAISSGAKGDFSYVARTKASPAVSMAWDLITGKTFREQESRTPEYFARQLLPFSISEIGSEPLSKTAIGLTGVKAQPLTVPEQVERGRYEQLGPEDQFKGIKSFAWNAMKEDLQDLGKSKNYREWFDNTLNEVINELIQSGIPKEFAANEARILMQSHPYVEVYNELTNLLETKWIADHPDEALKRWQEDMGKKFGDETKWTPTKDQENLMYAIYFNKAAAR